MKKRNLLFILTASLILTGCSRNVLSSSNITTSENVSSEIVTSNTTETTSVSSITNTSTNSTIPPSNTTSNDVTSTVTSLVQVGWANSDLDLIKDVVSPNITSFPYLENLEYEVYVDDEKANSIYFELITKPIEFASYLRTLKKQYTLLDTYVDDFGDNIYFFEISKEDKTYFLIQGYVDEKDKDNNYFVWINIYHQEDQSFLNQDAYTTNDISSLKEIVDTSFPSDFPFLPCYSYEIEKDEYYYNSALIYSYTTEAKFNEYLSTLEEKYGEGTYYEEDDVYLFIISYTETEGLYLGIYGYEYALNFVVCTNVYYIGEKEDEEPNKDGFIINAEILDLDSAYSKNNFQKTVNNINFDLSANIAGAMTNPYDKLDAIQIKKSQEYIKNSTAFNEATNKVIVELYSENPADSLLTLSIYGSNSVISSISSQEKAEEKIISSASTSYDNITKYTVEYTFKENYKYFYIVNKTGKALYIGDIIFSIASEEDDNPVIPTPSEEGYKTVSFTTQTIKNIRDIDYYDESMPTTGNQKVLVLPIDFSDYKATNLGYSVATLENVFNGDSNGLTYKSVHDYFYTSSFGALDITFDVYPSWIRADYPLTYYVTHNGIDNWLQEDESSYATGEQLLLNEVLSKLDSELNYQIYDSDNNCTIDGIIMIPTVEIKTEDNANILYWAFQSNNYLGDPSTSDPREQYLDYYYYDEVSANAYAWIPYQFLFEDLNGNGFNNKNNTNTYTLIHEFSHILGVPDYYDYAYINSPLGGYDVMDASIADHNVFSKMLYGWVTSSTLVNAENEVTLTLNKASIAGDSIIIANNFDESKGIFQEYWLLEYYTNDGLNAGNFGLFNDSGLLIYHVDASIEYSNIYEIYSLCNTNTDPSNEYGTKNNLIELVSNGEGYLFNVGDKTSKTITDNNRKKIPYVIEVIEETEDTITIKFTKNS